MTHCDNMSQSTRLIFRCYDIDQKKLSIKLDVIQRDTLNISREL